MGSTQHYTSKKWGMNIILNHKCEENREGVPYDKRKVIHSMAVKHSTTYHRASRVTKRLKRIRNTTYDLQFLSCFLYLTVMNRLQIFINLEPSRFIYLSQTVTETVHHIFFNEQKNELYFIVSSYKLKQVRGL